MAALFDSDHTTCEALSTAMALSAGEELTFDLPYYANSDHCFSNFYVNITYGFSGNDEYDVLPAGIINAMVSTDDVPEATSSTWDVCDPQPAWKADGNVRTRFECSCTEHCYVRISVWKMSLSEVDIDLCEIIVYW